jgi:hypothetical protein
VFLASFALCFWKELAWQMRGKLGFLSKTLQPRREGP